MENEFKRIREMLNSGDDEMALLGISLFHSFDTTWKRDYPVETSNIAWWAQVTEARMRIYEKRMRKNDRRTEIQAKKDE